MKLTRAELENLFPDNKKAVAVFEQQQNQVLENAATSATNVAATVALQDATVISLSANDALNNERILAVQAPLSLIDNGPGDTLTIGFSFGFTINGGYALSFNLLADTNLVLPPGGVLLNTDFSWLQDFADDAAAATGGIEIGGLYRNGNVLNVRLV